MAPQVAWVEAAAVKRQVAVTAEQPAQVHDAAHGGALHSGGRNLLAGQ